MKVPANMSYSEWEKMMTYKYGAARIEANRKMVRNRRTDLRQLEEYKSIIGKREMPKTFDKFQNIKYNKPKEWWLLKGYVSGVREQDLSTLTGFEHYKNIAKEIEDKLVGMVTSDGVNITGYKTHFIDGVIGTYQDKDGNVREGVNVDEAFDAVRHSKYKKDRNKNGLKSRTYFGENVAVTINPDNGQLIQANHV